MLKDLRAIEEWAKSFAWFLIFPILVGSAALFPLWYVTMLFQNEVETSGETFYPFANGKICPIETIASTDIIDPSELIWTEDQMSFYSIDYWTVYLDSNTSQILYINLESTGSIQINLHGYPLDLKINP